MKELSMYKVSVIVPAYNVEQELPECIDSIINQSYGNLEIILVNDGSQDRVPEIASYYGEIDRRIKVIHQDNRGLSEARNTALRAASGSYVVFVDGDDWLEPTFVQELLNMSIEKKADIVECGYRERESIHDHKGQECIKKYAPISDTAKILQANITGKISAVVWNKLYKMEVLTNCFFEKGAEYEDVLWTFEVLSHCEKIASVGSVLYNWRKRRESISRRPFSEKRFAVLNRFDNRAAMARKRREIPMLYHLACARIVVECFIILRAANQTGDKLLINRAMQDTYSVYQRRRLSISGFICMGHIEEWVRFIVYLLRYKRERMKSRMILSAGE